MTRTDDVLSGAAKTFSIAVSTSASSAAALPGSATSFIRVVNAGTVTVFIGLGGASVAATVPTGTPAATATPIPAGADLVFSRKEHETHISAITSSGTATLYVQAGTGI